MTPRKKPTKRVAAKKRTTKAEEARKKKNREYQRAYYAKKQAEKRAAGAAASNGGVPALPPMTITKAISRFLDSVRVRDDNGRRPRRSGVIVLGALQGFPQATQDPDVIDQAVVALTAKIADARSAVAELELRQRIRDLQEASSRIRAGGPVDEADEDRQIFIVYGAGWAASRKFPITYETFREMGVPADVLRDAAIPRRPTG